MSRPDDENTAVTPIPESSRQLALTESSRLETSAQLVVVAGARVGTIYRLSDGPLVLGRGRSVDISVGGDDASRRHAQISRDGESFVLEDLGSQNGTFVNNVPVRRRRLAFGDRIQLATSVVFVFTHHSQLERRVQEQQRMEALGRMAGRFAHDFNNVLAAISGTVDFLLDRASHQHPRDPEALAALADIDRASQRATDIIKRLVDFARGGDAVRSEQVAVAPVVHEVIDLVRRSLGDEISLEVDVDPAARVHGSRGELHQVLLNLVVNARDAMPDGGRLTIRGDALKLERDAVLSEHLPGEGYYARIRVSDTGIGMDEDERARAFEPFFTTKGPSGGSGLGLPSVYGIVRSGGGNVRIQSQPGEGTTVTLWLPAEQPSSTGPDQRTISGAPPAPALPARVLVVDDAPETRRTTARLLRAVGYETLEAADGRAALDILQERPGRLQAVMLDIVLPGRTGDELIPDIRAIAPDVRVLLMSGSVRRQLAESAGADGFIAKPFGLRQLREALADIGAGGPHDAE